MKKLNLIKIFALGAAIFTLTLDAFAKYPIVSRRSENGGFFGYNIVDWHLVEVEHNGSSFLGAQVKCSGSGFSSCPKKTVGYITGTSLDAVDELKAEDLINHALQQIENGVFSGTHNIKVHVVGTNETRIYSVDWSAEDAQALNSNITVSRLD